MPQSAIANSPSPVRRGRPPTTGLRQSILRAAEEIFTQRDYHEVLMDDVARTCGVGKGTLYRYFPGKRELYLAVMFEGIERLHDELRVVTGTAGPPVHKVRRVVRCILAHFWDRRLFFALLHRNEHKPDDPDNREWLKRRGELARLVQRALAEAHDAGQIRCPHPRIATEMLLGMLRGVNRYRGTHDSLQSLVDAVVELFLFGVGTEAARAVVGEKDRRRG